MGIPILGTMFSPGELWPEPPTETALLRWLRLIKAADEFKDKTTAIDPKNDSGHRDPKQPSKRFHPGLCPSQRGPKFAGEEPTFNSNRRLNGCHAAAMPLKRAFAAWPCETAPVAAGRGTRSALAH